MYCLGSYRGQRQRQERAVGRGYVLGLSLGLGIRIAAAVVDDRPDIGGLVGLDGAGLEVEPGDEQPDHVEAWFAPDPQVYVCAAREFFGGLLVDPGGEGD